VAHWVAAHELVAAYVPPTGASRWSADRRQLTDESDPAAWLDVVEPDEFPLSMFYTQLKQKLEVAKPVAA
jgi:hypothetical protein